MKKGVWIDIEIWELYELSLLERFILSDIQNFSASGRQYFKTNKKLAEECHCSRASITRTIAKLTRENYVKITQKKPLRVLELTTQFATLTTQSATLTTQSDALTTQIDALTTQSDAHISKVISKRKSKVISKIIKEEIIYPFQELDFIEAWRVWILERKEKKLRNYTTRGEQSALHNLQEISGGDYKTAIKIINNSITHGWQGLFALKEQKTRAPKITQNTLDWINKGSR